MLDSNENTFQVVSIWCGTSSWKLREAEDVGGLGSHEHVANTKGKVRALSQ